MNHPFTKVPNVLFDQHLAYLSGSELKILLFIIRQTYGWFDKKTGGRKSRSRITHGLIMKKTGLSRRAISESIKSLADKKLIEITDYKENLLSDALERKGQFSLFYAPVFDTEASTRHIGQILNSI